MDSIQYPDYANPRDVRLAKEHQLVDEFCARSPLVKYEAFKRKGGLPPDRYLFHYEVRSIISIHLDKTPIYGDKHTAEIIISPQFPLGGQPACKMITSVWHPNIKYSGNFAGKICINAEALGSWHTLDMLAERIGEMLQYKNYHALHIPPYPEDAIVAAWVREFAEPQNLVNKAKRIYVDDRPLLEASEEWMQSRKKKVEAVITGVRSAGLTPEQTRIVIQFAQPKRKQVTVIKKAK